MTNMKNLDAPGLLRDVVKNPKGAEYYLSQASLGSSWIRWPYEGKRSKNLNVPDNAVA
jgi:hypothetical protein